jgi:hypothetical protein
MYIFLLVCFVDKVEGGSNEHDGQVTYGCTSRRQQSQTQAVQVSSTITANLIIPQNQTKVVVACEVHVTEVETARSCAVLG